MLFTYKIAHISKEYIHIDVYRIVTRLLVVMKPLCFFIKQLHTHNSSTIKIDYQIQQYTNAIFIGVFKGFLRGEFKGLEPHKSIRVGYESNELKIDLG